MRIANISFISDPRWRWLQGKPGVSSDHDWEFYAAAPRNLLEKLVRKPSLARLRAGRQAAKALTSGDFDLLVSHLPLHTVWAEFFVGRRRRKAFHLAFTFNFTDLPPARRLPFFKKQFAKVDRFTVYSQFEREQYSRLFQIPQEKIDMVRWGVNPPEIVPMDRVVEGEYVCSLGGEGRDYGVLARAAASLPHRKFVIVAREKNLVGIDFPPNVQVFTNIPLDQANNILNHGLFSVVPLRSDDTACGHVTIVAAMHLGKAQVVTWSRGVTDYVEDGVTGLFCPVNDSAALAMRIEELWNDGVLRDRLGRQGRDFAAEHCSEQSIVRYFNGLLEAVRSAR